MHKVSKKDSDGFFNRATVTKEVEDIIGACKDWRESAKLKDEAAKKFLLNHCKLDTDKLPFIS